MAKDVALKKEEKVSKISWKYDDMSFLVCDCKDARILKSRVLDAVQYKAQCATGGNWHKRKIKSGLYKNRTREDLMGNDVYEVEQLQEGFQAIVNLIEEYSLVGNRREILRLIAFILSGYTSELFLKFERSPELFSSRAPVVLVKCHKQDFTGGFEQLSYIVRCFSVDTSLNGKLCHHNPAVIPDEFFAEKINDSAFMQHKGDKSKRKFPAQYRDTAVLVHGNFVPDSDIEKFVHRNPWATILLFNRTNFEKRVATNTVDLNLLDLSQKNWETIESYTSMMHIRILMRYFAYWLSEIYMQENISLRLVYWLRFGINAVQRYNHASIKTQQKIVQGSEKRYLWIQAATIRMFLDFCCSEGIIKDEIRELKWNEWCNALIPGSRDAEIFELEEEKLQQEEERNKQVVFNTYEYLLKSFIETAEDNMFESRKQCAKTFNKDVYYRNRPSILVGTYGSRQENVESIKAAIILKKDLEMFSEEKNPAFKYVIAKMWGSEYTNEDYLPYIRSNDTVTIRRGLSPNAVVLDIEKMTFLESGIIEKMMKIDE